MLTLPLLFRDKFDLNLSSVAFIEWTTPLEAIQLLKNLKIWGVKKISKSCMAKYLYQARSLHLIRDNWKNLPRARSTYTNRVDIFLDFLNLSLIFPWDIKATPWGPGGVGGGRGSPWLTRRALGLIETAKPKIIPMPPSLTLAVCGAKKHRLQVWISNCCCLFSSLSFYCTMRQGM